MRNAAVVQPARYESGLAAELPLRWADHRKVATGVGVRYLRFVVSQKDSSSGKRLGVIRAAWRHDEDRLFSAEQSREVQVIFKWFNTYLPRPDRTSRTRNASHKNKIALSWFKDSAAAPLQRVRRLAELLEACGVPVEMITTDRPGFVVYEDEFQIVAEPFADTGA